MNGKKFFALLLSALLLCALFSGCAVKNDEPPAESKAPAESAAPAAPEAPEASEAPAQAEPEAEAVALHAAGLNGPTGVGMVKIMSDAETGATNPAYTADFLLASAPDELVGKLTSGEVDVAALPTNLAAALYNKTSGGVRIAAVNTLGVLYVLEKGDSIQSVADLAGKTVYSTGEGSMPQYVADHILAQNGLTGSVELSYLAEHAELAAKAVAGDVEVCILPEPFVSQVLSKNPDMRIALNLTEEWNKVGEGTELSMGCLVVRREFAQNHKEALDAFLSDYAASAAYAVEHPAEAAALVEQYGIIPSAALAEKVIPNCNIVYVDGEAMKQSVTKLYEVLFAANPKSIGGALPGEDFFYGA